VFASVATQRCTTSLVPANSRANGTRVHYATTHCERLVGPIIPMPTGQMPTDSVNDSLTVTCCRRFAASTRICVSPAELHNELTQFVVELGHPRALHVRRAASRFVEFPSSDHHRGLDHGHGSALQCPYAAFQSSSWLPCRPNCRRPMSLEIPVLSERPAVTMETDPVQSCQPRHNTATASWSGCLGLGLGQLIDGFTRR